MKSLIEKRKDCWKRIFENIVTLNNEHRIAVLLTYFSKSSQLFFGPRNVKEKMRKSYTCTCTCSCSASDDGSWEGAFYEDNKELISGSQKMAVAPGMLF